MTQTTVKLQDGTSATIATKRGVNVWINTSAYSEDYDLMIKSNERPEGMGWVPAFPQSRVHGHVYTPYIERTDWHKAANEAMANQAQKNFQYGRR